MVLEKKDFANELYDAGLISVGLIGLSMLSQKVFREGLGVNTSSLKGVLKLSGGIAASAVIVKVLQGKAMIPKVIME